jgi:hypothetical protein
VIPVSRFILNGVDTPMVAFFDLFIREYAKELNGPRRRRKRAYNAPFVRTEPITTMHLAIAGFTVEMNP